ncbi:MAG TPA: universal stress protein [Steroidobacteraceae bacterium]|nr:universal stress protein [Steroidobacteraceae bacterium]
MRILCATDLLPGSDAAIDRAGMLSDQLAADLTLLHVAVPGESDCGIEEALQRAQTQAESRVRAPRWRAQRTPVVAIHAGIPGRIIPEVLAQSEARLLILGPRRRRPLLDAFEGSIAGKALAARIPLLVARNAAVSPYRRVLFALDASAASAAAVRVAESLVLPSGMAAIAVHADDPPYREALPYADIGMGSVDRYLAKWRREAQKTVYDMLRQHSADPLRYEIDVKLAPPAAGILQAVDQFSPDLLVMGTRASGRLRRAFIGSVANQVLQLVRRDVLIVPEGADESWNGSSRAASDAAERADVRRATG